MSQNIYDDPEFFANYINLPRQVLGLQGAPEWPALREMLPELSGKRVADLGCGFGWVSRWMRSQGAACVVGVDLSQNMITRAKASTCDPSITYHVADLETIALPDAAFDLVFSALTFHYIADFERLTREIHRALVHGGHLVFSIEHPIFMAAAQPAWIIDEDGQKSWPVNRYAAEGERRAEWLGKGVLKYHRTVGTTLNTLIDAGFALRRAVEFAPTRAQIDLSPDLAEERERPMILLIAARKDCLSSGVERSCT